MSATGGKTAEPAVTAVAEVPEHRARNRRAHNGGTYEAVHALQRAAGNQAVKGLLARGSGRPLDEATRDEMEEKFGEDFSDVRVHAGGAAAVSAAALRANAWTSGRDIVFGEGFFSPSTSRGKKLLAHELAHVVQQRRGGAQPKTFERGSASERDAANAAAAFAGGGPVSVKTSSSPGVAREEAETPWWKKRLNPLYQRALEVLPKEAADKLEAANETARLLVKSTGATDDALNTAVQTAEPVLKPIANYLGVKSEAPPAPKTDDNTPVIWLGTEPLAVQLQKRKAQQAAQAELDKSGQGALADPVPTNKQVSDLPPLDVLLRPDPPPTDFETKLKAGKPFQIQIHPKPDVDPRNAVWAGRRPSDEEMKNMRFADVNDPSKKIWVDQGQAVDLKIDNDVTMPIRDFKTNELRGYRVRHGDTIWVLDRNGEIASSYGIERPLEHPAIDPIDVAMLAADLGPLAAKGIQAGGKAILESIAKSGSRELGDVGGDAASKLLARDAGDALAKGTSHPSEFPELDLGPAANDVHPFETPTTLKPDALPDENVIQLEGIRGESLEDAQQEALQIAEGQDFDPTVASGGRSGSGRGPTLVGRGRTSGSSASSAGARNVTRSVTRAAAEDGPTIARFGKDEVEDLTAMWNKKLAAERDPRRVMEIRRYLKALKDKSRVRDWKQSEEEMQYIYSQIGGKGETAFEIEGAGGAKRVTKPDIDAPNVRGEVKNWEMIHIGSEEGAERMLDNLAKQIAARRKIPGFKDQTVILDLRGQKLTEDQLQRIGKTFADTTGLPPKNIQIVTWGK